MKVTAEVQDLRCTMVTGIVQTLYLVLTCKCCIYLIYKMSCFFRIKQVPGRPWQANKLGIKAMHLIWLHKPKHKLSLGADCTHGKKVKTKQNKSV